MTRAAALLLAALAAACASAPAPRSSPPAAPPASRDRTHDPAFEAARAAARPEFASQADALAAGVYERFVHPDSIRPAPGARDPFEPEGEPVEVWTPPGAAAGAPPTPGAVDPDPGPPLDGDPSTEELLGTLGDPGSYNPPEIPADPPADPSAPAVREPSAREPVVAAPAAEPGEFWTLQLGAYAGETGALVRIRQIARDLPDLPRWHAERGGVWRVYAGRFSDADAADRARADAAALGYSDAFVVPAP